MRTSRLLAFLFTDLVGSTEMLARVGETRAESIRRVHFGLIREPIAPNAGWEVKSLGDGLMAAFPSASDAVACAVGMQRAIAHHNRKGGEQLSIRIGIQAGETVEEEADYFGGPVVEAKRLCDDARGGQILVSDLVRSLAGARSPYPFRPAGERMLKGLPAAIPAFEVAWEPTRDWKLPLPPEVAAFATRPTPFIGRTVERERLRTIWREGERAPRRFVFVGGEPGIGKTRLAAELAQEVHGAGATVLWGRSPEESLSPFQPFVGALRHYVANCPPDELRAEVGIGAAALARLVPDIVERLPGTQPPPPEEAESERYRLFEAVAGLLSEMSAAVPVLLTLDDFQWADRDSILLLEHLARDLRPASVVFLVTYRDTEVSRDHPLTGLMGRLGRDLSTEHLRLEGLGPDEFEALLDALVGWTPSVEFSKTLEVETQGNPFFLQQVVRHLEEAGAMSRGAPEATFDAIERLGVPAGVREVIGRRLQRLTPQAIEALSVASVVGIDFELDLVARVLASEPDELVPMMDEGVEAKVLAEDPERIGRYSFTHALIQQALYEDHTANRLASLHARVGEALETSHAADPSSVSVALAHHFARSGRRSAEKVVRYARAAGERALAALAYETAAAEFEMALDALEESSVAERAALLVQLATALMRAGDSPGARASFLAAAEQARIAGDVRTFAQAALGFGGGAGFGGVWIKFAEVDRTLVELLEEALAGCSVEDHVLRVRLLGRLSQALYWAPEEEARRLALSVEALDSARRTGDRAAIAYALDSRHVALWGPDHLDERTDVAREMLRLATEIGDRDIRLAAIAWLITDALEAEDMDETARMIEEHASLADELHQPYYQWYTAVLRGMQAFLDGRFDEAEMLAAEAWRYGERSHGANAQQVYLYHVYNVRRECGGMEDLLVGMEGYVEEAPLAAWHVALAGAYAVLGRRDEALAEISSFAADGFVTVPRDSVWLATMAMLSEIAGQLGAPELAAAVYDLLLPLAGREAVVGGAVYTFGPVSRLLGILARVNGDLDRALEHLEDALARCRALPSAPLVASTQAEMASVLQARGAPGDAERASTLRREAAETARRIGMATLLADLRAE